MVRQRLRNFFWALNVNEAPQPDGLLWLSYIIVGMWLRGNKVKIFEEFHLNGKVDISMNSTVIMLVI